MIFLAMFPIIGVQRRRVHGCLLCRTLRMKCAGLLCRWRDDHLDIEIDIDVIADDDTAAVHRLVPLHAKILAIDLCGGGYGSALKSPGILDGCFWNGCVEDDLFGHAVDGEVAGDFQFVRSVLFDLGGFEGDGGILRDIEKVCALEVLIAVRLAGVHAGGVNGDVYAGLVMSLSSRSRVPFTPWNSPRT